MFFNETHEAAHGWFQSMQARELIPGYLGRPEVDGAWTFFVPGRPGFQFVRLWNGEFTTLNHCINMRAPLEPALRVWLRRTNGVLTVDHADSLESAELFGNNVGAAGIPQAITPSGDDPVESRRFLPGLVTYSTLGGLYVHIYAFWYDDGYYYDGELLNNPTLNDFDLASYVTAPSGYSQWVLVYFDPDAGELLATANTPVFGDVSVLDETAIDTSAIPAGTYPLGAVAIANGQTTIDGSSRFADLRLHLDSKGVTTRDWNRMVVDADGSVVTDADGFVVISA